MGAIIFSIGLIYIVIAVIIFFNKGDLFLTNINMGLIKNILFAATMYSLFLVISDLIILIYFNKIVLERLRKFVVGDNIAEIDIYKNIEQASKINSIPIKRISNWFSVVALPLSVAIIYIRYIPNEFIIVGSTIFTFGLVIISNSLRDENILCWQILAKDIWLAFYKKKF